MPYIKSVCVHADVKSSIAYILNPEKTEDTLYTASLNCMTNAEDAYLNMKMIYEHYSCRKYNEPPPLKGKGWVKAIHYIQSFDPKDNISPELAHKIAKAFALKTFGEDCQIVIATHVDKQHVHNHFILNSYGIDGQKFYANKNSLDRIKEYSDRVCLAFGVQPYDKSKGKGRTMKYNEWENKKRGTSWKEKIRIAIDGLLGSVKNLDDLICELEEQGFTVKRGKYISLRAAGQQRFVRLKTLGDFYSEDILCERIQIALDEKTNSPKSKVNNFNKIFYERIYQVGELVKRNEKLPRKYFKNQPYILQNDFDVYTLSAQLAIINRDNICSIGELESKIEKLTAEYENARQEINKLSETLSQFEAVEKQVNRYFDLLEKAELSETEKLQLKMCGSLAERCNIHDRNGLQRVERLRIDTSEKVDRLTEQMNNCKKLYDTYVDIFDTYKKISKGDYISNLIAEKKREDEHKKNVTHKKSR
ncbi:MAG: relaxase/mobilization nuclease domain-containing protein [Oscillospiraceae bacterium]|nr:relaxase/mobilization nuclease domain-containing protein [Oscillospiraceae bacterium]